MPISLHDQFILVTENGKRFYLSLSKTEQTHHIPSLGSVSSDFFFDKEYGIPFRIGMHRALALPPTLGDRVATLKRKAQLITPKDIAPILFYGDIRSKQKVLEAGTGSGAMTLALASTVAPDGNVVSYDIREDFSSFARENLRTHGLDHIVRFVVADVNEGIDETDFDRAVVDIPEPWPALPELHAALKVGGVLVLYLPTTNQIIRSLEALKELPFVDIRVVDVTEREHKPNEKAFRPENLQLVHTGYLLFARKVEEGF